jgi:hypothetical protein
VSIKIVLNSSALKTAYRIILRKSEGKRPLGCVINGKYNVRWWTGFNWLRTGIGGRIS